MGRGISNVLGIDDGPFERGASEPVLIAGPVFCGTRLDGLLTTHIEQDGGDGTDAISAMICESRFLEHIQLIMLGGITLGGFNVVDLPRLSEQTGKPVLAIARKEPNLVAIRSALANLPDGEDKWALIQKAGRAEALGRLFVHRVGLDVAAAQSAITRTSLNGHLPEPLRVSHIVAGGLVRGASRGGA